MTMRHREVRVELITETRECEWTLQQVMSVKITVSCYMHPVFLLVGYFTTLPMSTVHPVKWGMVAVQFGEF
jgi:hypothetical protein